MAQVGLGSATLTTLTTLAGQAKTELLGDSFLSQGAYLHGDYFGKVAIAPVSTELVSQPDRSLKPWDHPPAIREGIQRHFAVLPAG